VGALAQANRSLGEQSILPESSLGRLLKVSANADAIDIVVKLKDVHYRARSKAAHSAIPALCAGNLVSTPAIKGDAMMGRKGLTFLSAVALAVSEDCDKCGELRQQSEAQEKWKLQQAEKAEEIKKSKSKATPAKKSLRAPFNPADSRRDMKKPRGYCAECAKGYASGRYLYYCGECDRGFHLFCIDWKHVRLTSGGSTWFACPSCIEQRDKDVDEGDHAKEYLEVDASNETHGFAPTNQEAGGDVDAPSNSEPQPSETGGARSGAGPLLPSVTPARPADLNFTPRTPHENLEELVLNSGVNRNKTNVGVNVKDYYVWEAEPPGWRAKPDGPKHHPEKGYSKAAYHNWRRKVVTQRDQVKAAGSSMGPLTRAIGLDIKARVGAQFLKERSIDQYKPKPNMTGKEIDAWVASDPEFKWFEKIPDELLLEILDRRFGVKTADHFLAKQFYTNLPMMDEHGEVNYHAAFFNQWATEWQNELMELQKAQVNFEAIDLKQVLLNALTPHPIVHKKAVSVAEDSYIVLLATLCDWVIAEEERVEDAREQKNSLLKLGRGNLHDSFTPQAQPKHTSPNPRGGGGAAQNPPSKTTATALLTQLASHLGVSSPSAGGQAGQRDKLSFTEGGRSLPAHLKRYGDSSTKLHCRGCNNNWESAGNLSVPCYRTCKYAEHPDYNKDCRERESTKTQMLTWKGFRERFPNVAVPQSLLLWEEKERNYAANRVEKKRSRDEHPRYGA
jgi:hypothetical protein